MECGSHAAAFEGESLVLSEAEETARTRPIILPGDAEVACVPTQERGNEMKTRNVGYSRIKPISSR